MAKPAQREHQDETERRAIAKPLRDERICIDEATGTIPIAHNGIPGETYSAAIKRFTPGTGVGPVINAGEMTEDPGTPGLYTIRLSVGNVAANPAPGINNRAICVEDAFTGDIVGHAFAAVHCGSSGSQMAFQNVKAKQRCSNCSENSPVPVALLLTFNSKVAAGTCAKCNRLNEPTILRYANDAQYPCSWFSEPIVFCAKNAEPGIWMLQKANGTTWRLTLQCGKAIAVSYEVSTKKKDCSLPIQLTRVGKGGKECKQWPKTVTIEAAP